MELNFFVHPFILVFREKSSRFRHWHEHRVSHKAALAVAISPYLPYWYSLTLIAATLFFFHVFCRPHFSQCSHLHRTCRHCSWPSPLQLISLKGKPFHPKSCFMHYWYLLKENPFCVILFHALASPSRVWFRFRMSRLLFKLAEFIYVMLFFKNANTLIPSS